MQCHDETMAVWLMRAVIVENILARREGNVLYLPVSLASPRGDQTRKVVATLGQVWHLWQRYVQEPRTQRGRSPKRARSFFSS